MPVGINPVDNLRVLAQERQMKMRYTPEAQKNESAIKEQNFLLEKYGYKKARAFVNQYVQEVKKRNETFAALKPGELEQIKQLYPERFLHRDDFMRPLGRFKPGVANPSYTPSVLAQMGKLYNDKFKQNLPLQNHQTAPKPTPPQIAPKPAPPATKPKPELPAKKPHGHKLYKGNAFISTKF